MFYILEVENYDGKELYVNKLSFDFFEIAKAIMIFFRGKDFAGIRKNGYYFTLKICISKEKEGETNV